MSATGKRPSYTAMELEEETGFDRRTIAYYVQEGLLPRVGRRGPRTRYPATVRDRLVFVRRVREAEEAGDVPAVSLRDLRKVFDRVPPALIARVADGEIAVTPELVERASTRFRLPGTRRATLEDRVLAREGPPPVSEPLRAPPSAPSDEEWLTLREGGEEEMPAGVAREAGDFAYGPEVREADGGGAAAVELADALARLGDRAERRGGRSSRSLDTWTRIEVSPEIELSVRGIGEEDAGLVERVKRAMRRVMGGM